MKNILVPIDFSPASHRAVHLAVEMALVLKAKVWLVHVAAPDPDFVGFKTGPTYIRQHRAEVLREEHSTIQSLAENATQRGVDAEGLLVQGPTTETILAEAEQLQADMIVMGSHGRSGLYRTFVGSVSEQVLRDAKVPVLIIPKADQE